ncbi:MAG: uroporphyrinogen decarboxylase [Proteobacteria bacterium]|nr:uroporphyrinogen decarboxylase [Pseudomonadota bacterium]MDP6134927.1 mandelate racemase/muconate lactonizing enzyme family protein [Arenicellales bacterium]MDP7221026.1 mandelate racemase/muconate lactonizing enzyme family protein [Arenicellales bacterium]HJP11953.1 mandelate racemase/muconate lactonizing enzyme family protein [Arenicellales bacterium]
MKIIEFTVDHFQVPLPAVLSDATHGEMTHFGLITVRIVDDQGCEGLGYTYTVHGIGASAIRALIRDDLGPFLLASNPDPLEDFWQSMWWRVHFVGRGGIGAFAMAAIDIALWDLQARSAGQPLWRFLGGSNRQVQAYAGGIDLDFSIDELIAQGEGFLAQGFQAIKMKVGRPVLDEDVSRVGAMREFLGSDFPLMVDANMRWSAREAEHAAKALAPMGPYWLEEPTIPDDIEGHARVASSGGIPIASGENLHSVYEFRDLIKRGGVTYPEPDAATLGGITPWLEVASLAESSGLRVTSHGVHDIHVHLLAAVRNASYLEVHGFGLEQFIAEPLSLEDGLALAPERAGHGISLDFAALEEYRLPD